MKEPKQDYDGSSGAGGGHNHRKGRRTQRTILNLGMPFVQVDDFVNQSEDAIAIGYRVLEKVVKEIQCGYEEAKAFNRKQEKFEKEGGPPPPIPWEQMVSRAQNLQNLALDAMKEGTDVFFDSIKSGMTSMKSAAGTWQRSRSDVDTRKPSVAGPVFADPVEIVVRPGETPETVFRQIKHRGLARLRIIAEVKRPLQKKVEERKDQTFRDYRGAASYLAVNKVSFDASDEETSVLRIDVGQVGKSQEVGTYEGYIEAKNFELLIAKLTVTVTAGSDRTYSPTPRKSEASAPTRPRTSPSGAPSMSGSAAVHMPGRPTTSTPKRSGTQKKRRRPGTRPRTRNR